jgi:photosystem II stability/assembly factor-like uncharacterized protein
MGSWYPAWNFYNEWDEKAQADLIESARKMGITVLNVMLPRLEGPAGVFNEMELQKIDFLLDTAAHNHIYLTFAFLKADVLNDPFWANTPYYNPSGIDGIIFDEKLNQTFRNRIKFLIERTNSINGQVYRDDTTIMSWMVVDEPVSPDFWYAPGMAPKVTLPQLTDWIDSTAQYIKSLDPNHLVSVFFTTGANSIKGADWTGWKQILDLPSIDFVFVEDSDFRILEKNWPTSDYPYTPLAFGHDKPVVMMAWIGKTGIWDRETDTPTSLCRDYVWQAETLKTAYHRYFAEGVSGIVISNWGSDLYPPNIYMPPFEHCLLYTDTNAPPIDKMLLEITQSYNPATLPDATMPFVKIGGPVNLPQPLASSSPSENSWIYKGPDGQSITALMINPKFPQTLYVGTMGTSKGVLKTTNGGKLWESANQDLAVPDIRSLAMGPSDPTILYAGTNNGMFKSINAGRNWQQLFLGQMVLAIAVDPVTPDVVYAGTDTSVLKSVDGGETWQDANTGLPKIYFQAITVDPQTTTTLYAGSYDGVFKSTDGGASWQAVNNGLTGTWVYTLAIDPSTPTTIYAGTFEGVFKSVNGGGTWIATNNGLTNTTVQSIAIDPKTPTTLYAGTYGGVFRSMDSGASWTAMNNGLTVAKVYVLALDSSTSSILYAGTSDGAFALQLTTP